MKPKYIFWGLFLIMLGTLILISNFSIINLDLSGLWKLWPMALILWGISLILNNNLLKAVFAAVIAIVLALTIYGAGQSFLNIFDKDIDFEFADGKNNLSTDTAHFVEPFDQKIKNVDLRIDTGAGSFYIVEPTTDLIRVATLETKDNYTLKRTDLDNSTLIDLIMKKTKIKLRRGSFKNKVEIGLNSEPIWNLNFDLGAAKIDFDLSHYKVSTVKFELGAASLNLKLGDKYPETILDIDADASSIDIEIPDSSGCEINSDVSLSSKKFSGFKRISSDLFRTENFEKAKNKIYIRIDAGVSSIKVNRYSESW